MGATTSVVRPAKLSEVICIRMHEANEVKQKVANLTGLSSSCHGRDRGVIVLAKTIMGSKINPYKYLLSSPMSILTALNTIPHCYKIFFRDNQAFKAWFTARKINLFG